MNGVGTRAWGSAGADRPLGGEAAAIKRHLFAIADGCLASSGDRRAAGAPR